MVAEGILSDYQCLENESVFNSGFVSNNALCGAFYLCDDKPNVKIIYVIDSAEPENTLTKYLISVGGGKWRKLEELTENHLSSFGGNLIDVAEIHKSRKKFFFSKIFKLSKESVKINGIDVAKTENSGGAK